MDFNRIITHMNDHHQDDMAALCKKNLVAKRKSQM